MTTTNNNREYAIRLYYEVREADNSLNCKTAYKVFDNMQDAVNYAIDFIANNPDANIRLTNEHFNGSQISVYGDSSSTNYDLTDADINAVRNVEVNEADVEDYAVTEETQDVATISEIRNANTASGNYSETIYTDVRNGRKIFESVTYKNHSIVRVEAPRYGLTLDITFRGNRVFKHNGRRIAAKAVAEVYMNRERADEQYKIFSAIFKPHHFGLQNRQRVMFTVDVRTTFANGTARNFYGEFENYGEVEPFVQEVKTLADELNIPVEVSTEARYNKYPQATAWVDPHQYGVHGNLEQPRDISVYCNEPATNVTAAEDTVFAAYEAAINGDRAYVLKAQELFTAHADGDTLRSFQLAYAQDRKQYGENISQALRALGDNRSKGYNEKLQSLIDAWDAESDKALTVNKTIFNQRLIEALIQKFDESENAQAVNKPATPTVEPTDDDNTFIATDGTHYVVKGDRVDITADGCQLKINGVTVAQYKTAHAAQVAANEIRNFRETYGGAACLPHKDFDPADFDTMFNDNDLDFSDEGKTIIIDALPADPLTAAQAEYESARAASQAATQAVIDADNALRHAKELERQAAERESAAFFKLDNLKREITDTVDQLNAAAPEGWSVVPDPDNKKFFVKAGGKSVAEIDSLALAKVLPPDKFFARFTPLTDDEPNQRYADQLYQEYLELLDMRDNLSDDPERLKVIDGLIRDLEREMLAARLDLPTSTPTTAC